MAWPAQPLMQLEPSYVIAVVSWTSFPLLPL